MSEKKANGLFCFFGKRALLGLSIVFLASCRLVITTDESGYIVSASGSSGCNQASCVIPITEPYAETFTAVAADGYRFVRWTGLCKRFVTEVCKVKLIPLPDQFIEFDDDVRLSAVFESSSVKKAWYRDNDADNHGAPDSSVMAFERPEGFVSSHSDCDDANDSVYPGAREQADGLDNDCDGRVDEGIKRFYPDVDGDGFGALVGFIDSLDSVVGYVRNNSDCDDNNARIFPGADEALDSFDNDCDGLIDEGMVLQAFYRDVDGDGFGDASQTVMDVVIPAGFVANGADNCVDISNPRQLDSDKDGLGDACDSVDDRNGSCALSSEDQLMLDAVNAARSQARVCGAQGSYPAALPVTWSCELEDAALAHSMDMANNNRFSHTGSNGGSVGDRVTRAGYVWSAVGENIAAGFSLSSVAAVVQAWIESPGHCANLMRSSYSQLGASKYRNASSTYDVYWTQVFGRPR